MHVAAPSSSLLARKHRQSLTGPSAASRYSADVINAYIGVRDQLVQDVEKVATLEKLNRLSIANDLVLACLKPARAPYEAQCLPDAEAVRERGRCDVIRSKVTKLLALVAKANWR
ncbi:MAG: hypothetical protein QOG48_691 [Verrucomicrobiota bacterium]|jgi:hypothetical protein